MSARFGLEWVYFPNRWVAMRSVNELYELQELDWEIQRREEELSKTLERLADDSRRAQAYRRLAILERKLSELGTARRQSERAVETIERRISEIDSRMYGGMVTNPRELEAYQEERTSLSENQAEEEDRLLEFMVEFEDTEVLRDDARAAFERVENERRQEVSELGARRDELSASLPDLHARRGDMASEFEPALLGIYENARRTRGGQGAALVDRRGLCHGCRLVIPNAELARVRAGEEIAQCGNCSRILIYEVSLGA